MFKLQSVFALLVSATTLAHAQSVTPPNPQTLTTPVTDPRGQVIPHDVKKTNDQAEPEQAAPQRKAAKTKHSKTKAVKAKTKKASKAGQAKAKKTKATTAAKKSAKKPAAAKRQHLDPAL